MSKPLNIDQLFQKAKTQPVGVSFETTKNQFLKHLSAGGKTPPTDGKGTFFTLKNVIIMISSISAISLAVIFLLPSQEAAKKENRTEKEVQPTIQPKEVEFVIEEAEIKKTQEFIWPELETQSLQPIQSFRPKEIISAIIPRNPKKYSKAPIKSDYKYYPKLTPEEIAANHKQKKKMVKALMKFDKKSYAYIPSGSFEYNDQKVSVQSFWIQVNEVTNLEYRTFLFDLLIQGKKAEFDIAKPEQENWTRLLEGDLKAMEEQYFSHEAFNDYPVVNVTRAGAEMYCAWLTKAVNANADVKINDLRIPTRAEWYKAASNEGKQLPFPWDRNSSTNEDGCYLANYKPKAESSEITEENTLAQDGAMFTAKTGTYNPNGYGLYNLSGNVAEMVYNTEVENIKIQNSDNKTISSTRLNDKTKPGTAGGSWLSSEDEIKLNGPDPYEGITSGHPGIGFRVVITHLRK